MRATLRAHISAMCEVAGKVKAGNLLHNRIRVNECSRLVIERDAPGWDFSRSRGLQAFTAAHCMCLTVNQNNQASRHSNF